MDQLKRHRKKLWKALQKLDAETGREVAEEISRLFNAERKLRSFIKRYTPDPPDDRPAEAFQADWDDLENALAIIYDHRSRDLHDGIAFPSVLCEPPLAATETIPAERFPALGVSSLGGEWTAERLPLYLHVFVHAVGDSLRKWWRALAETNQEG